MITLKHVCLLIALFIMVFCSCNKNAAFVKTFNGNLPIVSTSTPTTTPVGSYIISQVRFQISSISGAVTFQKFDITEVNTLQFDLKATALYKDWNTQTTMPVMWTMDTISKIKTTVTGRYILNFYNSAHLIKSDTVQVN